MKHLRLSYSTTAVVLEIRKMTEYNRTYYSAGYTVDMQWICHDVQHGTFQSWQKVPCVEPDIKGIPLDGVFP